MFFLERLAEQKIRAALERGELDNLPLSGKPLRLDTPGLVPEDLTLIAKSSKHENAKQPHWAQARSSCWGTRSPPL